MSAELETPIRVMVVDDQELFVFGIRMLIESQSDLELAATSTDGAHALDLVAETDPDVVLMDIRMPLLNGIETTRRIVAAARTADGGAGHGPRVIMLTTFQQEEAVFESMKHGASAYVTKDVAPEVLLDTIRSVHAGDAPPLPVGAVVKRHVRRGEGERAEEAVAVLSPREREIYLLAAKGLRNSEIAAAAHLSEPTVKSHVRSILSKLGLRSRAQIVVHAYEHGLLS